MSTAHWVLVIRNQWLLGPCRRGSEGYPVVPGKGLSGDPQGLSVEDREQRLHRRPPPAGYGAGSGVASGWFGAGFAGALGLGNVGLGYTSGGRIQIHRQSAHLESKLDLMDR